MAKIDVMVPTKDPARVRPRLREVLESAPWVGRIVYETSVPLSTARVEGARKCSTEWIAMFDDDVEIPGGWYGEMSSHIKPGVLAVSSPSIDVNVPHMAAYKRVTDRIKPLETRDTPFIDNTLIRRDALLDYRPPPLFYAEDELLYRHVKARGRWVHPPPCGVRHYLVMKDVVQAAAVAEQLGFYPLYRFIRGRLAYFAIPLPAMAYSRTWRTVPFFYRWNVQLLAGWLKAKAMSREVG